LKENYEIELKRTISDLEAKCSKFQQQHDGLAAERQTLQRSVQLADEERQKLRDQLVNLQAHVEKLKAKIGYRDGEISRLQLQIDRMEKERRLLRNEIRHAQLGQQHTKAMKAELRINEIDLKTREHLIEGFQEQLRLHHLENKENFIGKGDFSIRSGKATEDEFTEQVFDMSATCES